MEAPGSRFSAPRRTVTAPVGFPPSQQASSSSSSSSTQGSVETLYNHPNVKIIAFTASARSVPRSPSANGSPADDGQGALSWSSQLERTIAVGTFRIYRAPGSVAFLNCGSALQPILPKSQCWCIEEDSSKFVLQIRKPQYWRIELPVVDAEDVQRAVLLKDIFDKILLFEKTRCPFQRSFTVVLPEPPKTPVQKKPWTPVRRSFVTAPWQPGSPEVSPTATPKSARSFPASPLKSARSASAAQLPSLDISDRDSARLKEGEYVESPKIMEPAREAGSAAREPDTTKPDTAESGMTKSDTMEPDATKSDTKELDATVADTTQPDATKPDTIQPNSTGDTSAQTTSPGAVEVARSAPRPAATGPEESGATKPDQAGPQLEPPAEELKESPESPQETPARVETPVKVKEVVLVIEERITEDPTPLTAVNEAITQAQQQAAIISPINSPAHAHAYGRTASPSSAPGLRNISPLPAPVIATAPAAKADMSTRISAYEPLQFRRSPITAMESYEDLQATLDTRQCATPPIQEEEERDAGETIRDETLVSDDVADEVHEGSGQGANILRKRKLRRYGGFASSRSATMPPRLTVVTSTPPPPPAAPKPDLTVGTETDACNADSEKPEAASPTESSDSFHSVQAWQSPTTTPITSAPGSPDQDTSPQTFPYPHDNIFMSSQASHHRDISDLTVTPHTRCTWDAMSTSSGVSQLSAITAPDQSLAPTEVTLKSNASEDGTCHTSAVAARPLIRHRSTASISSNRALSPLPPAATLFSPKPRAVVPRAAGGTRMELLKRVPMAIVSKTCEMLLGPPAYLVQLMLKVASRITAGEWQGLAFGFGEGGEKIPVQWDYSDGDLSGWSEGEADYVTPPLEGTGRTLGGGDSSDDEADDSGRSWGVD
ncbi:uncharacterized protein DNG_08199 [Cephalotrichum gorgonifer]|uniref:Inheritance of peroxisomes protein 1 n=1 Tax=Cephalotrichum gorgonifer TaxID=2041049 RepID=A0AAE8N3W5_9PEZI|nr:uncharacterized protein DNG_08199 [Cephalotrichum gorgonifer]